MYKVIFNNDKEVLTDVTIKKISSNVMEVKGLEEPNLSGFELLNTKDQVFGKYNDFTTLYRQLEGNTYQVSNDGSVYVEPDVDPNPQTPEPTLEEIKEAKVTEMNNTQQAYILAGVEVTLSDGTQEHFDLTEKDQISLMGCKAEVLAGKELIPWHTSDNDDHCKFYSNADMALITEQALNCVAFNVTYFRDLRIWINNGLETKEDVENIVYGTVIPVEFRSDPLKVFYDTMGITNNDTTETENPEEPADTVIEETIEEVASE